MAEQKSLTQVIQERKQQYQQSVQQTIEKVYDSGNLQRIEKFERAVEYLGRIAAGSLEKIASESAEVEKPAAGKKQRLTYYQYVKARNEGMTNAQIKKRFATDSHYQLGAYASSYSRNAKKQKAAEESPKKETRMHFSSTEPEEMRKEAYARLDAIGKDQLDAKDVKNILGSTSNSYQTYLARAPEIAPYVTRGEKGELYFKADAVRAFIAARTPCRNGWSKVSSQKAE
jgi:hypothetical protein